MRKEFLPILVLLFVNLGSQAHAGSCASIVERDCDPLPRVTYGRDLRIEIKTRKRTLAFPFPKSHSDDIAFGAEACPHGKCACDEFVQHLDFKGPLPGFRKVNEAEYRAAAGMKCSAINTNVAREVTRFAVTKRTVSTAIFELEYCRSCGGSCHGHTALTAYDASSGKVLTLRDAIAPSDLDAVKARVLDAFVTANFDVSYRATERQRLTDDLTRRQLLADGLYVERGRVFVNLDTFALGCADGSFYPVEIPVEFLTPDFRARL